MALIDEQAAAASAAGGTLVPDDAVQVAGMGQAASRLGQSILERATGKGGKLMGAGRDKAAARMREALQEIPDETPAPQIAEEPEAAMPRVAEPVEEIPAALRYDDPYARYGTGSS